MALSVSPYRKTRKTPAVRTNRSIIFGSREVRICLVCASSFGGVKRGFRGREHDQGRPFRVGLPTVGHGIDGAAAGPIQLVAQGPAELAPHQRLLMSNRMRRGGANQHRTTCIEGFGWGFINERPGRPSSRLGHALASRDKGTSLATGPDYVRACECPDVMVESRSTVET